MKFHTLIWLNAAAMNQSLPYLILSFCHFVISFSFLFNLLSNTNKSRFTKPSPVSHEKFFSMYAISSTSGIRNIIPILLLFNSTAIKNQIQTSQTRAFNWNEYYRNNFETAPRTTQFFFLQNKANSRCIVNSIDKIINS